MAAFRLLHALMQFIAHLVTPSPHSAASLAADGEEA
jgi:hypothetical protein